HPEPGRGNSRHATDGGQRRLRAPPVPLRGFLVWSPWRCTCRACCWYRRTCRARPAAGTAGQLPEPLQPAWLRLARCDDGSRRQCRTGRAWSLDCQHPPRLRRTTPTLSTKSTLTRHLSSDEPRVLVVDGSRVVRRLIEQMLKSNLPGVIVLACETGAEAIAQLAD